MSSSPRWSRQAKLRRYVSSDHFSVDGTLLEAWASHKSFKPKDGRRRRNRRRRAATPRCSGTARNARTRPTRRPPIPRPGCPASRNDTAAKLCYAGHLLMEHRNALIVDAELTAADRLRRTRHARSRCSPGSRPRNGGAPSPATRATTPKTSSPAARQLGFTPHVAPEHHQPALSDRRSHHPPRRPRVSQRIRKRIEEPFGWIKTIAGGRKLRYLGRAPQPGLVQDHRRRLQPASASPPSTPDSPDTPAAAHRRPPAAPTGPPNRCRPADPTKTPAPGHPSTPNFSALLAQLRRRGRAGEADLTGGSQ